MAEQPVNAGIGFKVALGGDITAVHSGQILHHQNPDQIADTDGFVVGCEIGKQAVIHPETPRACRVRFDGFLLDTLDVLRERVVAGEFVRCREQSWCLQQSREQQNDCANNCTSLHSIDPFVASECCFEDSGSDHSRMKQAASFFASGANLLSLRAALQADHPRGNAHPIALQNQCGWLTAFD